MANPSSNFFLHGAASSVLIHAPTGEPPLIAYWGARIDEKTDPDALLRLRARQGAQGGAFVEVPASLSCEAGTGYLGPSGLQLHRDGKNWAPTLKVVSADQNGDQLAIVCADPAHGLRATYQFSIDPASDVVRVQTAFENTGDTRLTVDWASVVCLRTPPDLSEILTFSGRWSGEFQTDRGPLRQGGYFSENLRGRTSHDRSPSFILCTPHTNERGGPCFGAHLGWSGNHRMRVDTLADGRRIMQAGECFVPGEMRLEPSDVYETPTLYCQYSANGLSDLSQGFHNFYNTHLKDKRVGSRPRPVHYNTWEGIYFDHKPAELMKLADAAADIGAERFVLDDGWFKARRHDQAGLGDWVVDRTVYPGGLQPLIDYVRGKGMEFGLWVEPEMVNEDSDLFRAHPDWVLGAPPAPPIPFRHQLVLDLTRPEAAAQIFDQLDAVLREHDGIAYLKWDMNRDVSHPGGADGSPAIHRQTRAVYALIDRLRAAHPSVEIESCSSGGARADYGVLERTDRIWTSDSNDALDRQMIQRGVSFFFPLSVIGAHVGPRECHITGRTLSMALRAATAFFGHMGVEANLLRMDEADRDVLKQAIALYKEHRALLHRGDFVRLDGPKHQNAVGVVAQDKRTALYSVAMTGSIPEILPGVLHFPALDPGLEYQLRIVWPTEIKTPPPHRLEESGLMETGYRAQGDLLMNVGLQLPLLNPETCLIFEATAL